MQKVTLSIVFFAVAAFVTSHAIVKIKRLKKSGQFKTTLFFEYVPQIRFSENTAINIPHSHRVSYTYNLKEKNYQLSLLTIKANNYSKIKQSTRNISIYAKHILGFYLPLFLHRQS